MRVLFAVFCAFVIIVSAPAVAGAPVQPIKRIGIIGVLPDQLVVKHVGVLVFTDSERVIDGANLGLGDLLTAKLAKALSSRYDVEVISANAPEFDPDHRASSFDFKAAVRARKPDPSVDFDAYLLVYPYDFPDSITETKQSIRGVGLFNSSARFPLRHSVFLFTAYRVALIDGRSLKELKSEQLAMWSRDNPDWLLDHLGVPNPICWGAIVQSVWPSDNAALSAEQIDTVKQRLDFLLDQEVPSTLHQMELLP